MTIPAGSNLASIVNGQPNDASKVNAELAYIENNALYAGGAAGDTMQGPINYGTDSGTANAYVVNLNPALSALTAGITISFVAAHANTGASTLNTSALGVKNLLKNGGTALAAGDITVGLLVTARYDGTAWQMVNPIANPPAFPGTANVFTANQTIQAASNPTLIIERTVAGQGRHIYFLNEDGTTGLEIVGDSGGIFQVRTIGGSNVFSVDPTTGKLTAGIVPLARIGTELSLNFGTVTNGSTADLLVSHGLGNGAAVTVIMSCLNSTTLLASGWSLGYQDESGNLGGFYYGTSLGNPGGPTAGSVRFRLTNNTSGSVTGVLKVFVLLKS